MDIYDKMRIALYISETTAAITGFIKWQKVKTSYWKWFCIYLAVISVTELATALMFNVFEDYSVNQYILEYFAIPLQFLFFSWLFYKYFEGTRKSLLPIALIVIYIMALLADIFFLKETKLWFLSFSYTVGNIVLLVLLIAFFSDLMNSEKILRYRSLMMFWISIGLLLFYLGTLPLYGMYNTLVRDYPKLYNKYWIVNSILDCVMYLFFAISFIWGKPK